MRKKVAMWIAGRVAKSYQLQLSRPFRGRSIMQSRVIGMRSGFNTGLGTGIGLGLALGSAFMFILDPERGKRRRTLLQGRVVRAARHSGELIGARSKDLRQRAQGAVTGLRTRVRATETPETAQ